MAPSVTSSRAAASFPSDLYVKYKQATSFFQRWLLRARKSGVGASIVAAEPSTSQSPQDIALQISSPPSLGSLRRCRRRYSSCGRKLSPHPQPTTSGNTDFANYYAVLDLLDDYFPLEEETEGRPGAAQTTKKPRAGAVPAPATPPELLYDFAFDDDLNLELSFMFMELEELSEAVYDAFLDVKREKKTIVEATAVAKVAVDCAATVIARLQLRYPSIATGQDMIALIQERAPPEQLQKLLLKAKKAWTPVATATPKKPPRQYVAGTIVADLLWVSRGLESFVPVIPVVPQRKIFFREDVAGEIYEEERTPHYCTPDMNAYPAFFAQQLPLLYNVWLVNHLSGIKHTSTKALMGWFLSQTTRFFTTRTVSIELVFLGICWIRSVAALQGSGGLSRHISCSIMQRWLLKDCLQLSVTQGSVRKMNAPLHGMMERAIQSIDMADNIAVLLRANPILAGCMLLDHQFR